MDRGLDDIIAEKRSSNGPRNRRGGDRRRDRQDFPRDGPFRNEGARDLDSEWVHDRYEENNSRREPAPRRRRGSPSSDIRGSKLKVENIHYDLTEEDLDELFRRIGTVTRLQLLYDRSGRSEGIAYVTYQHKEDAAEAIKQFDGANANGQPIKLTSMSTGQTRNPFDTAVMPSKPLAERISAPGGRDRSLSPRRKIGEEDAARKGIDRYIPGGDKSRSRSPMPRRRGGGAGRRPGARRDGTGSGDGGRGGRGGRGERGERNNGRTKKTQDELDAEMEDYFGGNGTPAAAVAAQPAEASAGPTETAAPVHTDDIDMIE